MKKNPIGWTIGIASAALLTGIAGGLCLADIMRREGLKKEKHGCDCGCSLDEAVAACEDEDAFYGYGPDSTDDDEDCILLSD